MQIPLKSSQLLSNSELPLATTLSDLNRLLHGGLPPNTLTEIYGTKSTFKTQFILTLAAQTALSGSGVIILDSDSAVHKLRLVQIIASRAPSVEALHNALKYVHIVQLTDWNTFTATVHMLPIVVSRVQASFVAIDSMSTLFRTCSESAASKRLEGMVGRLRQLAISHGVCIIVTNGARQDDIRVTQSAMGEAWRHAIGTRLCFRRQRHVGGTIEVIKSGVCASGQTVPFEINELGIIESTT